MNIGENRHFKPGDNVKNRITTVGDLRKALSAWGDDTIIYQRTNEHGTTILIETPEVVKDGVVTFEMGHINLVDVPLTNETAQQYLRSR